MYDQGFFFRIAEMVRNIFTTRTRKTYIAELTRLRLLLKNNGKVSLTNLLRTAHESGVPCHEPTSKENAPTMIPDIMA